MKGFDIYTKVSLFLPGGCGVITCREETSWVQLLLVDRDMDPSFSN